MSSPDPRPVPFSQALAKILEVITPLEDEEAGLLAARGRVLAAAVVAPRPHPPRDDSAMDGYAVRTADLRGASKQEVSLEVVGESAAGTIAPPEPGPGEAVRIFTGAPLPAGTDAVVRQEATRREGDRVHFWSEPTPGDNIRRAGEDFVTGATLLEPGTILGPPELAVVAAVGLDRVRVFRRPRVLVLTSGDELVPPGSDPRPGTIYDCNATAICALVSEAGGEPVAVGPVADSEEALHQAFTRHPDFDLLLTVAGISVGDRDLVAAVLAERGVRWLVRGVRMRPGKAVSFGLDGGRPVFGLPGNPAAAMVAFETLARPALLRLAGHPQVDRPRAQARLELPISKRGGSIYFVRGVARDAGAGVVFRPLDRQGPGMLTSMLGHDALAEIEPERVRLETGDPVTVLLLATPAFAPSSSAPIVAFVGSSGSGKTTLLEGVIAALVAAGVRVAAVKHTHHGFAFDREGKDTWRLARAGAMSVAAIAPDRVGAVLAEADSSPASLAPRLFPDVDLVVVEGFHRLPGPKVLVVGERGLEERDRAVAADAIAVVGGQLEGVPELARGDAPGVAALLREWMKHQGRRP